MKKSLPLVVAVVLITMTLSQLVQFEAFVQIMASYHIFTSEWSLFFSVLLVGLQILALPFLLGLTVTKWALRFSACALLIAPLLWLSVMSLGFLQQPAPIEGGLFGESLSLSIASSFIVCIFLVVMAVKSFLYLDGLRRVFGWMNATKTKRQ